MPLDVQVARAQTVDDVDACSEIERFGHDERARAPALPADTPEELREEVTAGAQRPDHVEITDAYTSASSRRSLDGQVSAVWLRALADTGELVDYGPVTDRAGRDTRAVGFTSASSGLPTRDLLLLDPDNGQLLGSEQALTQDAGKLDVPIPSVIGYGLYFDVDEPAPPAD